MLMNNSPNGKENQYRKSDTIDYPKKYFSFVDKVEILNNDDYEVHLESVKVDDYEKIVENPDAIGEMITYNLVSQVSQKKMLGLFGRLEDIDGTWFKIDLTNIANNNSVAVYEDAYGINQTNSLYISYIDNITKADNETNKSLSSTFSLKNIPDAKKEDIVNALNIHTGKGLSLNVYDVGQGSMTAICRDNVFPLVYIDMGGGCYNNAHTYRSFLRHCTTKNPLTILTHWDADHIWTAHHNYTSISNTTWIVPRQNLSPLQLKFLKRLINNNNRILVFPSSLSRIDTVLCTIVKCTGPTLNKNESGIAVYVPVDDKVGNFKALLPGDASYKCISHLSDNDLSIGGIMATHHGANFKESNSPIPTANHPYRIIYQYGLGNTYGHARPESVKAHYNNGWGNIMVTTNGNISFNTVETAIDTPCSSVNCDLKINKSFHYPPYRISIL